MPMWGKVTYPWRGDRKIRIRNLFQGLKSHFLMGTRHRAAHPQCSCSGLSMPVSLGASLWMWLLPWTHSGHRVASAHHFCTPTPEDCSAQLGGWVCILALWSVVISHVNWTPMAWSQGLRLEHGKPGPSKGRNFSLFNLVPIRS